MKVWHEANYRLTLCGGMIITVSVVTRCPCIMILLGLNIHVKVCLLAFFGWIVLFFCKYVRWEKLVCKYVGLNFRGKHGHTKTSMSADEVGRSLTTDFATGEKNYSFSFCPWQTLAVSDHYPVEVRLLGWGPAVGLRNISSSPADRPSVWMQRRQTRSQQWK